MLQTYLGRTSLARNIAPVRSAFIGGAVTRALNGPTPECRALPDHFPQVTLRLQLSLIVIPFFSFKKYLINGCCSLTDLIYFAISMTKIFHSIGFIFVKIVT